MKPLPPGGTIGVAAPASPYASRSEVLRGVEWWEAQGYKVKLGTNVYARDDYVAGDARGRADDLNALFADPDVDVVQALQGGYGSAQTIPHLDFHAIAANPKPLVGYSDITALHVAVHSRTGLPTVYGNGLMGVNSGETTDFTRERLLAVLRNEALGEVPNAVMQATVGRGLSHNEFARIAEATGQAVSWTALLSGQPKQDYREELRKAAEIQARGLRVFP